MDLASHPCFDPQARLRHARAHLPVAVGCNVQCHYCDRRFDCANECRPGVTSALLRPADAAAYVDDLVRLDPTLSVVGIAGPGDPLAHPEPTLETLRRVRAAHPDLLLCLATNGLALPAHADDLAEIGVSHVTVTVNAVDPAVGERVYAWVRVAGERISGREAAAHLWAAQAAGIRALVARGVLVKINFVLVPGVNDHHVTAVASQVAELGARRFNCMPLEPVPTTVFGQISAPSAAALRAARHAASAHLPQMEHCARCRADAVGRIGAPPAIAPLAALRRRASTAPTPTGAARPYVAVASHEGLFVNRHLGEAHRFYVFEPEGDAYRLVAERVAPEGGTGDDRWRALAAVLGDCHALLASAAGPRPSAVLLAEGLTVHATQGLIEDALGEIYAGRAPLPPQSERFRCGKGVDCEGTGARCG